MLLYTTTPTTTKLPKTMHTYLKRNGSHARTAPFMGAQNNGTKSITFHSKETKGGNVRRLIEV